MGKRALKEEATILAIETDDEDFPFEFIMDFDTVDDYDGFDSELLPTPELPTETTGN